MNSYWAKATHIYLIIYIIFLNHVKFKYHYMIHQAFEESLFVLLNYQCIALYYTFCLQNKNYQALIIKLII